MGTEIWVVATGGAYGAAMVATPEAKSGLLLDRMEAQLLAAEESRSLETQEPAMAMSKVVDLSAAVSHPATLQAHEPAPVQQDTQQAPAPAPAPPPPVKAANVDRVALAREFSRLMDDGPEEGR